MSVCMQVRKDPRTEAFYVDGLMHAPAQTAGRALRVLSEAMSYRHTRAHKLNSYSSRSHCLITMTISSQDNSCSSPGQELMQGVKAGGMRRWGTRGARRRVGVRSYAMIESLWC